jgi:hypothetical protein
MRGLAIGLRHVIGRVWKERRGVPLRLPTERLENF